MHDKWKVFLNVLILVISTITAVTLIYVMATGDTSVLETVFPGSIVKIFIRPMGIKRI